MKPDEVGIGVIGAGRIGALHALNVARHAPGARLVGVADIDLTAAQRAVAAAGEGWATDDASAVFADPSADGVIIASSTATHAAYVVEAARHGKHALCEKPVSQSLEATRAAMEAAKANGVIVQLGFNRRFDPGFAQAHAALRRGEIGTPWLVRLVGRDPRILPLSYLEGSGGQFKDQNIHEYDMARWLSGSEVEEVFAAGSVLVEPGLQQFGDVDTSVTTLRFASGALGLIDNCRVSVRGYDTRVEVHGSGGTLFVNGDGGPGLVIFGRNDESLANLRSSSTVLPARSAPRSCISCSASRPAARPWSASRMAMRPCRLPWPRDARSASIAPSASTR